MEYEFFLPPEILPKDFIYPKAYLKYASGELLDLEPWHFYYLDSLVFAYEGLKKRYPMRVIVPFARRSDNDDVACFNGDEITDDPKVIIIHDWASPGWENRGEHNNFLDWLELAKVESKDWKES